VRKISILGSTGSIGTQALEVLRDNPGDFKVECLAVKSNYNKLNEQIREFSPKIVCVYDEKAANEAKKVLPDTVEIVTGMDGLIMCATMESVDIVVGAVVGMIGVRPVIEAVRAGKDIALANKESLVTAGHIIMPMAKEKGVSIYPVDSEHSAIFQALHGENKRSVSKIILTASGGPFRGRKKTELEKVTVEDALKHPNWLMGKKITIDSATMVNKGLEVMEAKWLFDTDIDRIQVLIQPQSVIHSMVEFDDGAVIAQLGTPDMRLPIQYALYYPDRIYLKGERLDFGKIGHLDFEEPDYETFEGLSLALRAGKTGGTMPTVYNAANECAVAMFLDKKIAFLDIPALIRKMMENHTVIDNPDVDTILAVEEEVYNRISKEGI